MIKKISMIGCDLSTWVVYMWFKNHVSGFK